MPQPAPGNLLTHPDLHPTSSRVTFVSETNSAVNDRVDAAYPIEYDRYGASYVDARVASRTRATTLKLVRRP
ncbi:DUF2255 family protein [Streptomyces sp. AcE210]|uniref:DUF2255 family protein n=1 Tax=Streptomyces sp. AcE210 TaxID=2292703 RepID=UPI000E30229E|nr:DUF2255 family protein [Streptomyces sp. AcE210]RFC78456.1 DUF2255 family protein [Streptomyces sp. AcE210]